MQMLIFQKLLWKLLIIIICCVVLRATWYTDDTAYSWLRSSLGSHVNRVLATDKTLKHCQCVWISLILFAQRKEKNMGVFRTTNNARKEAAVAAIQNVLFPLCIRFSWAACIAQVSRLECLANTWILPVAYRGRNRSRSAEGNKESGIT